MKGSLNELEFALHSRARRVLQVRGPRAGRRGKGCVFFIISQVFLPSIHSFPVHWLGMVVLAELQDWAVQHSRWAALVGWTACLPHSG